VEKLNLETFSVPVIVTSNSGKIISLNKAALRYFECEDDTLSGQALKTIIPSMPSIKSCMEQDSTTVVCSVQGQPLPTTIRVGCCNIAGKQRALISFRAKPTRRAISETLQDSLPTFAGVAAIKTKSSPNAMGFLSLIDDSETLEVADRRVISLSSSLTY
jgi:nitrogen-specific signal transduction histidine kinase